MPIELPRRRPPSEHVVGRDAVRLVAPFEGLSLKAYPDPASPRAKTGVGSGDPWTIGYGRARGVKEGDTCTLFQADEWLMEDLNSAGNIVKTEIKVPLTPGEFTALVSLVFNLGYIPRSLKAALNGGTSDKGEVFAPGSYGSALKQFVRNCRAAGVPMRGLLRRRLAEACVYSDLPWEAACSINLVRLKCDAQGNIDPVETTSLEDTLERARQDLPMARPPIDVTKAWPQPAPIEAPSAVNLDSPLAREATIDGIPVQLPIPEIEEDELLLEQPAASPVASPETAKGSPPVSPQPTSAAVPSVSESAPAKPSNSTQAPMSKPATGEVAAAPPSRSEVTPLPPKLPDPPIPIGQQTSAVDATRKSEDWSDSAKSMIYSRRFWGLSLVVVGRLWMLKTGSNAVLGAVSDPIVTEMFSGFMVMMIGEIVQHWGKQKATRPLK